MSGAVVIRRCASAEEAAIVCALLNDAGIPASLENWHHAMIDWGVLQALNGVAVCVPAYQIEAAKQAIIEYADSAEDRLKGEFESLDPYPLKPKMLRVYILIAFFSGLAYAPVFLAAALLRAAMHVTHDARSYGFDWSLVAFHFGRIDWLTLLGAHLFAMVYFLVPLSIFVFLARQFLDQRAAQKQTA